MNIDELNKDVMDKVEQATKQLIIPESEVWLKDLVLKSNEFLLFLLELKPIVKVAEEDMPRKLTGGILLLKREDLTGFKGPMDRAVLQFNRMFRDNQMPYYARIFLMDNGEVKIAICRITEKFDIERYKDIDFTKVRVAVPFTCWVSYVVKVQDPENIDEVKAALREIKPGDWESDPEFYDLYGVEWKSNIENVEIVTTAIDGAGAG